MRAVGAVSAVGAVGGMGGVGGVGAVSAVGAMRAMRSVGRSNFSTGITRGHTRNRRHNNRSCHYQGRRRN